MFFRKIKQNDYCDLPYISADKIGDVFIEKITKGCMAKCLMNKLLTWVGNDLVDIKESNEYGVVLYWCKKGVLGKSKMSLYYDYMSSLIGLNRMYLMKTIGVQDIVFDGDTFTVKWVRRKVELSDEDIKDYRINYYKRN